MRRCVATGSARVPSAWRWSPAIALRLSLRATPNPSRTSRPHDRASWWASIAFTSGDCMARPGRSGRSPRSTRTPATPGPNSSPPPTKGPAPRRPAGSRAASRQSSRPPAGGWNACSQTTATSSAARSSPTRSPHSVPVTPGSAPAAHRPTGTSKGCTARSSKSAGAPRSRFLQVRFQGLRRKLARYLTDYNHHWAHTGRITAGRCPAELVDRARKMEPR
jgi:hypothetical protein